MGRGAGLESWTEGGWHEPAEGASCVEAMLVCARTRVWGVRTTELVGLAMVWQRRLLRRTLVVEVAGDNSEQA